MGEKTNEHKAAGSEETVRRVPLGKQTSGQLAETKLRVVGNEGVNRPVLDVAAFNSFIG